LIEEFSLEILNAGGIPFCLGGDHSITYPLVKAAKRKYDRINLLHLDAHPDLYEEFEGNRFSHACPFARIMEENLVGELLQVGIRTLVPHQREQARRFGVRIIEARQFSSKSICDLSGPLYISLDMDVFDPAFAPGVSHYEPGGLSSREVLNFIQQINVPIIGADLVEYNPTRDPSGITAMLAGKLMKELFAQILQNQP
jgi:agmatinase